MNGNEGFLASISQSQLQRQSLGNYQYHAPKSIMQQLLEKADELRANLAKVDGWKAELAQCERMLTAAEEPKDV